MVFSSEHAISYKILNLFRTLSSWGSSNYRPSAPFLYEVASHVKKLPFRPLLLLLLLRKPNSNIARQALMRNPQVKRGGGDSKKTPGCLMTSNDGLTHGWAETKVQEKMDVAEMRMLRWMCGATKMKFLGRKLQNKE